jgi:ubiquinone/menaquinone biosynthesis C-methylase UbiE
MVDPRNPQATQMADESMIRTLAAQAEATWPQERPLLERYGLRPDARVLDVGCGTGEWSRRVAALLPAARVEGVDVLPSSVAWAARQHAALAPRLAFAVGDAYALEAADAAFDLVACRHVLQAIPEPQRVIAELVRVTRPGGVVHLLSEDYGMLHLMSGPRDPDLLWRDGPIAYTARTGTDARVGRRSWSMLRAAGMIDVTVDYLIIDTLRVARRVFADILTAWRDGYAEPMAEGSGISAEEFRARFDEAIAGVLDPAQYGVWMIPIVAGRKPARAGAGRGNP